MSILGGEDEPIPARVANISEAGLKLISSVPVQLGETLRVEIDDNVLIGIVRYSETVNESEVLAGVELINWIDRGRLKGLLDEWTVRAF
jgi:hypothetical protein